MRRVSLITPLDLLFATLSLAAVAGAVVVVQQRNPVYSALGLIGSFVAVAGIFLILHAPFVAVVQVAVYAGAIVVLFLFVIMLLNLKSEELGVEVPPRARLKLKAAAAVLFALLASAFVSPDLRGVSFAAGAPDPEYGSTRAVGEVLMKSYVLPFEVTSVLIIVAIVGAVVLAKKKLE